MPDKRVTEDVKQVLEQGEDIPTPDAGTAPAADNTAPAPNTAPVATAEQPAVQMVDVPGHGEVDMATAQQTATQWLDIIKNDTAEGKYQVAAHTAASLGELLSNLEKAQPYDNNE
jgi:hypothetical protein